MAGCAPTGSPPTAASAPESTAPRDVRTAAAVEQVWERTLRVTGELRAFEEATLSAKVPGRLVSLAVDLGTRVHAGEELARIETRDYELKLAQAAASVQAARALLGLPADEGKEGGNGRDGREVSDEVAPERMAMVRAARAELDDASRERVRIEGMVGNGVASQSELDTAVARELAAQSRMQDALEVVENRRALLAQRRAELAQAQQQLADATLYAPFDGAVAMRMADRGEYLSAGDPVVRLVRFDPVRLRLRVPEPDAPSVHGGQAVRVRLEGREKRSEGVLVRLGPELEPLSRTLLVEAELANADGELRPGSFATAEIVLDAQARSLVVPLEALVRFAGIDRVIAVVDGATVERRVTVGRTDATRAELLDGLAANEIVVLAPGNLRGGARVRAAP